jgi:hypothetical protein
VVPGPGTGPATTFNLKLLPIRRLEKMDSA